MNELSYVVMMTKENGSYDGEWWPAAVYPTNEEAWVAINRIAVGLGLDPKKQNMMDVRPVDRAPLVPDYAGQGMCWRVSDFGQAEWENLSVTSQEDWLMEQGYFEPGIDLLNVIPHELIDTLVDGDEMVVFAGDADQARKKAFTLVQTQESQ